MWACVIIAAWEFTCSVYYCILCPDVFSSFFRISTIFPLVNLLPSCSLGLLDKNVTCISSANIQDVATMTIYATVSSLVIHM